MDGFLRMYQGKSMILFFFTNLKVFFKNFLQIWL